MCYTLRLMGNSVEGSESQYTDRNVNGKGCADVVSDANEDSLGNWTIDKNPSMTGISAQICFEDFLPLRAPGHPAHPGTLKMAKYLEITTAMLQAGPIAGHTGDGSFQALQSARVVGSILEGFQKDVKGNPGRSGRVLLGWSPCKHFLIGHCVEL